MVSQAVYNLLTANAALTALVGARIYPLRTPQAVQAPFLIYYLEDEPIDTKDGIATQELYTLQITAFATGYETIQSIRAAIKTALDRKYGTVVSNKIDTIVYNDSRDGYDDNAKLYKVDLSFDIRVNK